MLCVLIIVINSCIDFAAARYFHEFSNRISFFIGKLESNLIKKLTNKQIETQTNKNKKKTRSIHLQSMWSVHEQLNRFN